MGDNAHSRTQTDYLEKFDEYLFWEKLLMKVSWNKHCREMSEIGKPRETPEEKRRRVRSYMNSGF